MLSLSTATTAVRRGHRSGRRSGRSVQPISPAAAFEPVNLSLVETVKGFVSELPVAPTTIGPSLLKGITVPGGVSMRLVSLANPAASNVDDHVWFTNALTDTDLIVTPIMPGVRQELQLRSPASPERFTFSVNVPLGGGLRWATSNPPLPAGVPRAIEIYGADRKALAYVYPPNAYDADGETVDATQTFVGNTIHLDVRHRGKDLRYPVLVDPTVASYGYYVANDASGWAGWEHGINGVFWALKNNPAIAPGLSVISHPNHTYQNGQYGEWHVVAPPHTQLSRMKYYNWSHQQGITMIGLGLGRPNAPWDGSVGFQEQAGSGQNIGPLTAGNPWGTLQTASQSTSGRVHVACYLSSPNSCTGFDALENDVARFRLAIFNPFTNAAFNSGSNSGRIAMSNAQIDLTDTNVPTFKPGTVRRDGAAPPTSTTPPWTDDNGARHTAAYTVEDKGLGVRSISIGGVNDPSWPFGTSTVSSSTTDFINAGLCTGDPYRSRCPASYNGSFGYSLPEGVSTVTLNAKDLVANSAAGTGWTERIDRTAPSVALSSTLAESDHARISDGTYDLHMNSTDAEPSGVNATSGVRRFEVRVDGRLVSSKDNASAPCDGCSLSHDWSMRTERYGAGKHSVSVTAVDFAGNRKDATLSIDVAHASSAEVGPGSVNLLTGNLSVARDDVEIASFDSDLQLSRTYSSRDASAEADGPFGPGWVSSVPVDAAQSHYSSLSNTSDSGGSGNVDIALSDGTAVTFAKTSATEYTSPPGHEGLTLTRPDIATFELSDTAGNTTEFTKPSGSANYRPTAISQSSGATTTITYETAGSMARPVQIAAPPPAGVSYVAARRQDVTPSAAAANQPQGTRTLTFVYGSSSDSVATGTTAASWGAWPDRLKRVDFTASDPSTGSVATIAVAAYLYDNNGRLRSVTDPRSGLTETYGYTAEGLLNLLTPPGLSPWSMQYSNGGADQQGKLTSVSRASLVASQATATWSVVYNVPTSGAGAPYQMGSSDVSAWGQSSAPSNATALFPPDEVPDPEPSSYTRATISYLDRQGREVNEAEPGGRISVSAYDQHDNVIRELTARNRERALAAGSNSAARSVQLDLQRDYGSSGTELRSILGPMHQVQLDDGQTVQAREHTVRSFDEGSPAGQGPYHLVTTQSVGASISGVSGDSDVRTTKTEYDWTLRKPTVTVMDADGLALRTTTVYDASTGLVTETRQPAAPSGGDAHSTRRVYYTPGTNAADSACGGHPEWSNLLCKKLPAAQPGTPGLPDLPVNRYRYNLLNQVTEQVTTVGTDTRTTSTDYDAAGRPVQETVTSSSGGYVPATTYGYNSSTGFLESSNATDGGTARTITRSYDTLGRIEEYTDADGVTSTTTFDLNGRVSQTFDGKATQTNSYHSITGDLITVQDQDVGSFHGSYDADGNLTQEALPNGLIATTDYDETGDAVSRTYDKGNGCASNCRWLSFAYLNSIRGQHVRQVSNLSVQDLSYDGVGRLVKVRDTPAGEGCTIRTYTYDADSNRTSKTVRPPKSDGTCDGAATGTTRTYSIDSADRVTDSGYTYDPFGRITTVPAVDANGGVLSSTYFADDRQQSETQDGRTNTYLLDPERRVRQRMVTASGGQSAVSPLGGDEISHYAGDGDSPSWREGPGLIAWTRHVQGLSGSQATMDSTGKVTIHLANLHDDLVADAGMSTAATAPTATYESDEFGLPRQADNPRYSWLGSKQRSQELPSGLMQMGQRTYLPSTGRFLQTDPVEGGSCNSYDYVCQDPINRTDLDGNCPLCAVVVVGGGRQALVMLGVTGTAAAATVTVIYASTATINYFKNLFSDGVDPFSSPFVFSQHGKNYKQGQARLSDAEEQALANRNAGKAYNDKAYIRARQKIKQAEKHAKKRKSRQKDK